MDTAVKNIKIENLTSPRYVKPYQISFDLCGKPVRWECVKAHDSVSALLYHEDKDAFLLVKQFRPAVWFNIQSAKTGPLNLTQDGEEGYTYELCAGLMDKGKSEEQTVIEEIAEETGISGRVLRHLATIDYWFAGDDHRVHKIVHHFLLEALGGWLTTDNDPDHEAEEVEWVDLDDVSRRLAYPNERRIVAAAREILVGDG